MLTELAGKYTWARDIEAWTAAVIEGRTADEVIRAYGGEAGNPVGYYTFPEAGDLQGPGGLEPLRFHVQVLDTAGHVVAMENNGWTGSIPEIARRCSANGGRFFSVYWTVNASGTVCQAIDGQVTAYFESLYPIAPDTQPGEIRPPWSIGPEADPDSAWQTCMALMEHQTGLVFEREWTETALPTYRIPDPDAMLRDVDNARQP
ncbi:hypothetical protein LX15_000946 [Streptoalloteichus tenebrarius]|uniref:Uncharacterized protein n=1 Tax=Streptoalloteichus tenebrarius (strain ATCC 17920 / DSM 40477 / JCM 4838 / CBS 697.72 / NBRC 16177 / NCIMB 11028 / NRRL B-12390 / A12253. 1 / ISP 5477) TaxID=1933 RepID=A0ABT1HP29_STRSD|nr:DUF6461 domain-containing protein [Streptoalloteichus tenebrarius]MCP2257261.1 hypothetical protein [Streptoalloteichus tenebrarius]BFF04168.1 hypothetical protein GCM10020241_58430 [Streptoalloteichus tenebrarius]